MFRRAILGRFWGGAHVKVGRYALVGLLALTLANCGSKSETGVNTSATDVSAEAPTQVDRSGLQPCKVLGNRRTTAEDCSLAEETDQSVSSGLAAFNWPREMRRGKPVLLRLAVGEAPPPEPPPVAAAAPPAADAGSAALPADAAAGGDAVPPPPPPPPPPEPADVEGAVRDMEGETVKYTPLVGRYMSARLSGDGFDVVAQSPEHQEVLRDSVTHWDWLVTPKTGGTHTLTVTTQVEFRDSDGKFIPLRYAPETRKVEVKVPWWAFLMDVLLAMPAWGKALAGALGALAMVATAWWGLRRAVSGKSGKPEGEPPQPEAPANT